MSGIDNIVQKINEDNQLKIKQLEDETAIQIKEINDLENKKAQEVIDKMEAEVSKKVAEIERNAKSGADMANRQELLAVRQEMLSAAFDKALEAMKAMDNSKKSAYIKAMVLSSAAGDEKIVAQSSDSVFSDSLLSELNSALVSAGKQGNLAYDFTAEKIDGLILKKDGMEINLTYAAVIEQIKGEIDSEVSRILFGA